MWQTYRDDNCFSLDLVLCMFVWIYTCIMWYVFMYLFGYSQHLPMKVLTSFSSWSYFEVPPSGGQSNGGEWSQSWTGWHGSQTEALCETGVSQHRVQRSSASRYGVLWCMTPAQHSHQLHAGENSNTAFQLSPSHFDCHFILVPLILCSMSVYVSPSHFCSMYNKVSLYILAPCTFNLIPRFSLLEESSWEWGYPFVWLAPPTPASGYESAPPTLYCSINTQHYAFLSPHPHLP